MYRRVYPVHIIYMNHRIHILIASLESRELETKAIEVNVDGV